jgi:membrane protein
VPDTTDTTETTATPEPPRTPPAGHASIVESWHSLSDVLAGRGVDDRPPGWVPGWAPGRVARGVGAGVARGQGAAAWWNATRAGRALRRFNRRRGGLLCGGLAYTALFSLFAGLAIGYTIFMAVLGSHSRLRDSLLDTINSYIPGLIDTGHGGAIEPDKLLVSASSLAGVIAILVLLWSAMSFMGALRGAVRSMFGLERVPVNFLLAKARDLGGFVVLLVGLLVSSTVSVVATQAASWFLTRFDLPSGAQGAFVAVGLLLAGVVDVLVLVYVVRVLGAVHPPRRDLLVGCVTASVVLGGLRILGTSVITGSAGSNALLASFAAIVTVLLLVNFVARVVLLVCAWMANPPADPGDDVSDRSALPED